MGVKQMKDKRRGAVSWAMSKIYNVGNLSVKYTWNLVATVMNSDKSLAGYGSTTRAG